MKGLLSLLLVLMMLCSCGRAIPQEEIPQSDTPKVSEEQPADVETDEIPEEITPIEEETEVNPETDPQPQIEQTQPPEEIIHLPNQELSPTPPKEAEKVNPNTDDVQETVITKTFDVSMLDGLYDFAGALYAPWQMVGERIVEGNNRYLEVENERAISEIVEELKLIFADIKAITPSETQLKTYENQSSQELPKEPIIRFLASDFNPTVEIFPDFSVVSFFDGRTIYLDTNDTVFWDAVQLIDRYNESGYDLDRNLFDRQMVLNFKDGMELTCKGDLQKLNKKQCNAFLEELSDIVEGKAAIIPTAEQISQYENGEFQATMKYTDEAYPRNLHFGTDYIVFEGSITLHFYYAGNIQDELHDLFEKYAN